MRRRILGPGFLLCILLWQASAPAQQAGAPGTQASAQGKLTVTATVVASVGMVTGPDGMQHLFIANAADPADNVSRLQPVVTLELKPVNPRLEKPRFKTPSRSLRASR